MFLRPADGAQTERAADLRRQDDVETAHFGQLFQQLPRGASEAAALHPLLQCAPQHQPQKANQNVRLRAVLRAVENRPQAEVVFADPEAIFDLRQADVGPPELLRAVSLNLKTAVTDRSRSILVS